VALGEPHPDAEVGAGFAQDILDNGFIGMVDDHPAVVQADAVDDFHVHVQEVPFIYFLNM